MILLNKYKYKKTLGHGGFGEVYLVQDEKQKQYAIKLIPVPKIDESPFLRQCIEGQIQCLKQMYSPHIVKLFDYREDKDYVYLILEYCDGGDLLNYMYNLQGKYYPIQKATKMLSSVILGLEYIHQEGFLHRDIKPQNILVKYENGKQIVKITDFGVSKKATDIKGSIIGSHYFQSPEVLSGQKYGFQVDMWAFGVLFYYMLNAELPLKTNLFASKADQQTELRKLAQNFSYKKSVQKSKRKIMKNCTPQIEDLFKQIFQLNPQKRINFLDIRKHPIFSQHFPQISQESKILYNQRLQLDNFSYRFKKNVVQILPPISEQQMTKAKEQMNFSRIKSSKYPIQKEFVELKKDEIDFLRQTADMLLKNDKIFKPHERFMLQYNIRKYYLILMRQFKKTLKLGQLQKNYPKINWTDFVVSKQFKQFKKQVKSDLSRVQVQVVALYDQCEYFSDKIKEINPKFFKSFDLYVDQKSLSAQFKESYRYSISYAYNIIKKCLNENIEDNKIRLLLTMLVITHSFNSLIGDVQNLQQIFWKYIQQRKVTVEKMNFISLRLWLSKCDKSVLNQIISSIIKTYFLVKENTE